jgi:DNA topoisomerase-3
VQFIVSSSAGSDAGVVFPEETGRRGATGRRSAKGGKKYEAICTCPKCGEGEILENSKGYYCTRWKDGCKFTIWKDALKKTGAQPGDKLVAELCGKRAVKVGDVEVVLNGDMSGKVEARRG